MYLPAAVPAVSGITTWTTPYGLPLTLLKSLIQKKLLEASNFRQAVCGGEISKHQQRSVILQRKCVKKTGKDALEAEVKKIEENGRQLTAIINYVDLLTFCFWYHINL
jgi:hypothetical protein